MVTFEYANNIALLDGIHFVNCNTINGENLKKTGIHFEVIIVEGLWDKEKGNILYLCAGSEEWLSTGVQICESVAVIKTSGRIANLHHQQQTWWIHNACLETWRISIGS